MNIIRKKIWNGKKVGNVKLVDKVFFIFCHISLLYFTLLNTLQNYDRSSKIGQTNVR